MLLDSTKLGHRITVIIEITLNSGGTAFIDGFKAEMQQVPQVQQCYYVTGECDFVLIVSTENMEEYERLTRQLFFDDPKIEKFRSMVAMDNVKVGLQIPLTLGIGS